AGADQHEGHAAAHDVDRQHLAYQVRAQHQAPGADHEQAQAGTGEQQGTVHGSPSGRPPMNSPARITAMDNVAAASTNRISMPARPGGYSRKRRSPFMTPTATQRNAARPKSAIQRIDAAGSGTCGRCPERMNKTPAAASTAPAWKAPPGSVAPTQSRYPQITGTSGISTPFMASRIGLASDCS